MTQVPIYLTWIGLKLTKSGMTLNYNNVGNRMIRLGTYALLQCSFRRTYINKEKKHNELLQGTTRN